MTTKTIFNHIQGLNPKQSTVSSIGSFVSDSAQMMADYLHKEIISYIPSNSLAYKILSSTQEFFTEKQLWVITFELAKNAEFCSFLEKEEKEFKTAQASKKEFKSASNKIKAERKKDFQKQIDANMTACMSIGEGEEVSHPMFGDGVVTFSSLDKVIVMFDEVGAKTLCPKFAKLTRKENNINL